MLYNLFENRDFVSVFAVALLAEGVDRNKTRSWTDSKARLVALLAEGVDRNKTVVLAVLLVLVALLAEGVDRNHLVSTRYSEISLSPSSQRAWIEISDYSLFGDKLKRRPPRRGRG